jgi:hypothetical protein
MPTQFYCVNGMLWDLLAILNAICTVLAVFWRDSFWIGWKLSSKLIFEYCNGVQVYVMLKKTRRFKCSYPHQKFSAVFTVV